MAKERFERTIACSAAAPPAAKNGVEALRPHACAQHPPPRHRRGSFPEQSQPSHGNDLIDFGQSDGTPSTNAATPIPAYQAPADLQAAQTVNGGQQQKDLENTLRSTSNERTNGGALIDFSDDLKRDLPTVDANGKKYAPLKREDTDTQSLVRTSIS